MKIKQRDHLVRYIPRKDRASEFRKFKHEARSPREKQQRGYFLEAILYSILHDEGLDPRASYCPKGEQIDGSFVLGNRTFLLEAKWLEEPCSGSHLLTFKGKLDGKLQGTLGVFFSMSGYSDDAIPALEKGKELNVLCFDGEDIQKVVDGNTTIADTLHWKVREASESGSLYVSQVERTISLSISPEKPRETVDVEIVGPELGKDVKSSSPGMPRETVDFEILGPELGKDVKSSLVFALTRDVVFPKARDPLAIFREALATFIRDIEDHPSGALFQEFLRKGPYEDSGEIPQAFRDKRLTDADSAAAITFIYSHMINGFRGTITELLAIKPCLSLMEMLQHRKELPFNARLYVGDAVKVNRAAGKGFLKGADQYILLKERGSVPTIAVMGVIEVKSHHPSEQHIRKQIDQHLSRAAQGLSVEHVDYPGERVNLGYRNKGTVRIAVQPSGWKLPRSFHFGDSESGRSLIVEPPVPPQTDDEIDQVGEFDWRIKLKWSEESIAQAAYEMTFWYMEKVGEVIYSESMPKGWEEMTPAEAGRNAVKMMLYYAILRCRTSREDQRAIALYNSYGFGYALGMNYKNANGKREMLWSNDLDEILATGKTKDGCRMI